MPVIWCRTRHTYDSYVHLWELVRLAEFPTCFVDEIDWGAKDNTYIIGTLNGETPNPLPARNCKVIWGNFERPSWYNTYLFDRPDFDAILCCDREWAKRTGIRYFTMGSDARLGYYEPNKLFDIATNCYAPPRRAAIFDQLREFSFTPNSFALPDANFAASRIQLLPQQEEQPHCVTPLRFCIAAAYRLPVVYEADTDVFPFIHGVDFIHAPYSGLAEAARAALADPNIQRLGDNLHQKLCIDLTFRASIERMVQ